jgi:glyoxylase-like metal-dependent hydrolase (beta-lactamase superfamily II)
MEIYRFVFSPIEVNTYILADKSGDCAILDCGCYNEQEFLRLVEFIETKKLNPVLLLNTHCHLDHIFGNKFIFEKYNLKTHCSKLEESNRENASEHAMYFGLSMATPPEPESYISHQQVITFGSTSLIALLVPGHTGGSLAFYSEKDECVFSGDALFSGSIGRTDLPGGDHQTLIDSIRNNLLSLPSSTIVYPGHGPETTIEKEMKTNPYLA